MDDGLFIEALDHLFRHGLQGGHGLVAIHLPGLEILPEGRTAGEAAILEQRPVMAGIAADDSKAARQRRLIAGAGFQRPGGGLYHAIVAAVELVDEIAVPVLGQGKLEGQRIVAAIAAAAFGHAAPDAALRGRAVFARRHRGDLGEGHAFQPERFGRQPVAAEREGRCGEEQRRAAVENGFHGNSSYGSASSRREIR